jgi:mRNA interferase RelE/StbE
LYLVGFRESAEAELLALPRAIRLQIDRRISLLAQTPKPSGAVKLKGGERTYRLRSSNYRIVYEVDDVGKRVVIVRVRHRRDVYRNL